MFDRYPLLREVIVNLKTDHAFRGVLWRRARGYLVLRNVTLLRQAEAPLAVDGEVMIERANVDFVQVVSR